MVGTLSNRAATITMIVSSLGNGTLFMPLAFSYVGYLGGLIAIGLIGMLTYASLFALLYCCQQLDIKNASYPKVANHFSKRFKTMVDIALFFSCFGAMINAFSKCSQEILIFLSQTGFIEDKSAETTNSLYACFFLALAILPLCLKREIAALQYSVYVSVSACIYLIGLIFWANFKIGIVDENNTMVPLTYDFGAAIPYFVFALHCQFSIVNIFAEMENKSLNAIKKTTFIATVFSVLIYAAIGLGGYRLFGDSINTIILRAFSDEEIGFRKLVAQYDPRNFSLTLCSIGFILVLFAALPLAANPIIPIAQGWFFGEIEAEQHKNARNITSIGLVTTVMMIVAFVNINFDFLLSLSAAIFTNSLSFIFPFVFYLKTRQTKDFLSVIGAITIIASLSLMSQQIYAAVTRQLQ